MDLSTAFATFPILETERLILRAVIPDDAPEMFRLFSDPAVVKYWGSPPMQNVEQAYKRVANIENDFREQNGIRWAITDRASGAYIGDCGHWRLVKSHFRSEIGYVLDPAWWGKGIIPEAVGAALDFGFGPMGLHSVEAQIEPNNAASRRVLEKLGFVQEGYFRENFFVEGEFGDTAVFSVLKQNWRRGE